MTHRYEILDILGQDAEGVSFHAIDHESGKDVVLRRFFPFGPDGGGLEGEERIAYDVSISRLKDVSHPSLRAVVDGGTDPVDGMPFLVTERMEGERLSEHLQRGPLSAESVIALANQALETSRVLSEVFAQDAVWVDTDPATIYVSEQDAELKFRFGISPIRWLGDPDSRSDLKPLHELVENLCEWRGQTSSPGPGGGLGAWVKALRENSKTWSLEQARAALHKPGSSLRAPVLVTGGKAAAPPVPKRPLVPVSRSLVWPWVLAGILGLSTAGILVWKQMKPTVDPVVSAPASEPSADPAPTVPSPPIPSPEPQPEPSQEPIPELSHNPPTDAVEIKKEEVSVEVATLGKSGTYEGVILAVVPPNKRSKICYIRFKSEHLRGPLWAMFGVNDWKGYNVKSLENKVGKRIQVSGKWVAVSTRPGVSQAIQLKKPDQLKFLN